MAKTLLQSSDWTKKAETFARVRAQIRQILYTAGRPLDVAEIATEFKRRFRYLPCIERRLRELVDGNEVRRIAGAIPGYELVLGDGEE